MKKLFDPYFISYCLAWGFIHACRYAKQPVPLLNDHLTDLIAVPVMAHLALIFTRRYIVRNNHYTYPFAYLLFIALYISIIFEVIMPRISPAYTADGWDIVAYFSGSVFYYCFHQMAKVTSTLQLSHDL